MNWLGLENKKALVAGAGGIGEACIGALIDAGCRVGVLDADEARLKEIDREHGVSQAMGCLVPVDLREREACRAAVAQAREALGDIDILIHAVGVNMREPIESFTADDWHTIIDTNLSSAFWLAQEVGQQMKERRSGRIVFLSSVSGLLAHAHHGPYAASKGGLNQLLRVMAAEWAPFGVTVNGIAPGYVETSLTRDYLDRPGVRDKLTSLVPAGRLGTPSEATGPILFLCSDHASFVTGHILYVDGGRTLV